MISVTNRTVVFLTIFTVTYMLFILAKAGKRNLDLYDSLMLSTAAIIPLFFALFPSYVFTLSELLGVGFPFVILFGILFIVLFVFVQRLTVNFHRLELDNRLLIQEIGLLKQIIEAYEEDKRL